MHRFDRPWILSGLLVALTLLSLTTPARPDDDCGTRVRPEDVPIVRALQEAGVYDPSPLLRGPHIVWLTFHLVRDSNGSGGLDDVRLVRALDDANLYFANSGITFCWPGPTDYIDDDDFYYNIDTLAKIDTLRQTNVVPDTINIYFTENLAYEGGPICGISSFTWSDVQGIVMANACTATDDNHSSFPHEIGHYFDLLHTHETTFGDECVDGSNCETAGDLLCDTPADPRLGDHNVDANCDYFGNETDSCNNDPYNPDATNLMSYSRKHCRDNFTVQQDRRALATLQNLRPELINANCPGEGDWNLDGKLLADDGATDDQFAISVSLSHDAGLVGAYYDDDNGTNSGSAYVFRNVGGVWAQEAKLLANDGADSESFGGSVSLSGEKALIGALRDDDNGSSSGSAYLFHKLDGAWTQEVKLLAADGAPWDYFGVSVSLSGDAALVGALWDDDRGTDSGSAYAFRSLHDLRNPCPGDLDGDDDTDQADLGILLADWGCAGGNCPGDLDHDGDTDQADLGILLADWNCDAY